MASLASAARAIPQGSGRDNLTVVAAESAPVTRSHSLPTPPNSISPALPPHGLKAQLQKAKLDPIDSDLDLHDHPDQPIGSPAFDSTGVQITPVLLAQEYLPDILLNNGPLAIRYITGHLTSALPGFATIPPTKARRIVVAALEGKGGSGEGGGKDGDVVFEKVGWGRWDARKRGQPARQHSPTSAAAAATSHSAGPSGIPIMSSGNTKGWTAGVVKMERARLTASSLSAHSAAFSHDDRDVHMMDHEADKMSLDGSASASCSEAPDEDEDIEMADEDEVTDEEDWAAIGAVALREASYNSAAAAGRPQGPGMANPSSHVYTSTSHAAGGSRAFSAGSFARPGQLPPDVEARLSAAFGQVSDAQEREAVEALLRLGSV